VNYTKRNVVLAVLSVVAVSVAWFGVTQYHSHIRCAARNAVLREQVEKLKNDAHNQLRVGIKKAQVVKFFEEHQMRVTFGYGQAFGDIQTTGCAPFGCGADTALIGVSVAVDSQGTVTGEPHVSGIFTDCL
jgi:hypothetical protein